MKKLALLIFLAACARDPKMAPNTTLTEKKEAPKEMKDAATGYRNTGDTINIIDTQGKKQGKWIEEFPTDNPFPENKGAIHFMSIARSMYYVNGILDSIYVEYDKYVEKPRLTGHYKLGKKDGEWKYFLMGRTMTEVYKNGILQGTH
jgi:antitoxin component YwqK of YwqJK toxin-antitoxin module